MVSVSPAFQAAATADERRVVGYLYKGNEKLYGGDVIQSMKITELCGGGEDLVPGVCACSEAEAVLLNLDGALDGVFQTGQELIPHLGFLTENGEETVPMGVFAITSVENQDGKITLKLSDRMLRLEQPVTIETQGANPVLRFGEKARTLYLPYTLAALFSGLCYVMDMEFTSITFPNNTYVPGNVLEGETSGRNLLAYIAQAAGCFARMDRNGRLELKSYTAADAPLGLDDYFTVKEAGFSVPAITALTVRAEEGDVGRTIGEPGVSYVITGNPLLYRLNSMSDYAPIMQTILEGMGARPYAPMEIEARGNPAVQAGDILTAALRDGRTAALPVMTHTLTYNGGLRDTLASTGKAAEAGEQKGAIGESLKALNRKSHVLETDVEHSKSVISEIVTQVPYIGPEPPENPEAGRLWQDEADPPVLREWNGSAWITAADKTTVISSAVQQTKDGITMDFLNDKVSSYMEFTAEGLAIYDSPKGTEGRKTVFGYDTVEQVLKMVGEYSTQIYLDGSHSVKAEVTKYPVDTMASQNEPYVGLRITDEGDNRKFVVGKDVRGQNLKEDLIQSAGNRLRIECLGEKHESYLGNDYYTSQIALRSINPSYDVGEGAYADIGMDTTYYGENSKENYSSISMNATYLTFNGDDIWHEGNLPVESGTWKPRFVTGSWTYNDGGTFGYYYKIGRFVFCQGRLSCTLLSGDSNPCRLNLPIAASTPDDCLGFGAVGYSSGSSFSDYTGTCMRNVLHILVYRDYAALKYMAHQYDTCGDLSTSIMPKNFQYNIRFNLMYLC